jgi:hypothetical protein
VQRALVVSPFVDRGGLKLWSDRGKEHVLVSRVDQLDEQDDDTLSRFATRAVLAEALDTDEGDAAAEHSEAEAPPAGLHAKLYVVDDGWDAHVWTGSANATSAGFSRNVELLVQMTGKKSLLGVQRFLESGLSEMIQPYARGTGPTVSQIERELELKLRGLRRQLAEARWTATVGARSADGYPFSLRYEKSRRPLVEAVKVRPITLPGTRAQALSSGTPMADFGCCSLEALTSFFAFAITLEQEGVKLEAELVLKVQLDGAPEDREEQVLASLFKDPSQVMHFLGMLLAEDPAEWLAGEEERASRGVAAGGGAFEGALLERLLRALHVSPAQLDSVERFIRELSRTDAGRLLVNADLRALWEPIYAARQAQGRGAR